MSNKETRILGIDPGLAILGFGSIVCQRGSSSVGSLLNKTSVVPTGRPRLMDAGIIETSSSLSPSERLVVIFEDLNQLLKELEPELVVVEKLFFYRMSTTIPVAQARGVVLLVLAQFKIPLVEYTPNQVKLALTGSGKADKKVVQEAVARELGLEKIAGPDDASDALALALTAWMNYQAGVKC